MPTRGVVPGAGAAGCSRRRPTCDPREFGVRLSRTRAQLAEACRCERRQHVQNPVTPVIDSADLIPLVRSVDLLAAIVFAVSGALVASRKGMDVMGFMWFAVITGVGGGTVRDVILDVPVFWVAHPADVSVCLVTAVVMHFVAPRVESRYRTLLWFDAFGLALVSVAGTAKAIDVGAPALVAIAMGAVTGTVGGMIRDTLGHVPSILLRHEIYITASVLGGCTYVGCQALGLDRRSAMVAGFLVTFVVRGLAIRYGWSLPAYGALAAREGWSHERHASKSHERS